MNELWFWRGQDLRDYTKEQLVEIAIELGKMLKDAEKRCSEYMRKAI